MISSGNCLLNTFSARSVCVADVTSPMCLCCPAGSNSARQAAFCIVLCDCVSARILSSGQPMYTATAFITCASPSVSLRDPPPQDASRLATLSLNALTPPHNRPRASPPSSTSDRSPPDGRTQQPKATIVSSVSRISGGAGRYQHSKEWVNIFAAGSKLKASSSNAPTNTAYQPIREVSLCRGRRVSITPRIRRASTHTTGEAIDFRGVFCGRAV